MSSVYKGVSLQKNKNWRCQICFNNKQFCVGTFKTVKEARMAYDSAALKLRNGNVDNSDLNFPWTNLTMHELSFQRDFTTEAVLNMIRDGSYPSKLEDYINLQGKTEQEIINPPHSEVLSRRVFEKKLSTSDVGRRNRLLIPKKDALKFFPQVPKSGDRLVELTCYDPRSMRDWKFRYCYLKHSKTFFFTRGWNEFVTAHNLQPRDMITISKCPQQQQQPDAAAVVYKIEVTRGNQVESDKLVDDEELKDGATLNPVESMQFSGAEGSNGVSVKMDEDENGLSVETKKVFKLFGETIC